MQLGFDLVKPWQAPSDHIYSSLPPNKSKLLVVLVRENDVNVSCEDATMIRSC